MSRLLAAATVAALALGCTPTDPVADDVAGPSQAVLESRETLGDPMVDLGEAVLALADDMTEARHEVPRGRQMRAALRDVAGDAEDVQTAVQVAVEAADQASVAEAAAIVRDAAAAAAEAAEAARDELRFLRRVAAIDTALLDAAATWDERGSQSEIRARLAALADDVRRVRRRAGRLRPVPQQCEVLVDNRREWARTVRRRTERLQAHANSASGGTFDELRASFRGLPFGVEARTADAADVSCWEEHSPVPAAADAVRDAVDDLRDTLT